MKRKIYPLITQWRDAAGVLHWQDIGIEAQSLSEAIATARSKYPERVVLRDSSNALEGLL